MPRKVVCASHWGAKRDPDKAPGTLDLETGCVLSATNVWCRLDWHLPANRSLTDYGVRRGMHPYVNRCEAYDYDAVREGYRFAVAVILDGGTPMDFDEARAVRARAVKSAASAIGKALAADRTAETIRQAMRVMPLSEVVDLPESWRPHLQGLTAAGHGLWAMRQAGEEYLSDWRLVQKSRKAARGWVPPVLRVPIPSYALKG